MSSCTESTVLCVTGMHRSGTSLTASWLEMCGLKLDDGSTYGPEVGNPRGHFEDKDFVDLHADALKRRETFSKGWITRTSEQCSFAADEEDRARLLAKSRNEKYPLWGWKDPRTVLFLDQWKRLIPDLKVLLLWRPCLDVGDSLVRRSKKANLKVMKISSLTAPGLWKTYNRDLLDFHQRWPDDTVLLPLSTILTQNREAFEYIQTSLDLDLSYRDIATLVDPEVLGGKKKYPLVLSTLCGLESVLSIEAELASRSQL